MRAIPSTLARRIRDASRWIRGNHLVVAGVVDAGVSSAATFVVGLAATHTLEPDALGAYALAFSVFILSGFIPAQLVFAPTEIAAVEYRRSHQLPLLRASLLRGAAVSAAAAIVTSAWVFVAPADLPHDALPPLAISCALATFISPIQDHLRRMLHIAESSWRSVVVAVVQMLTVIAGVAAMSLMDVPKPWIPFGTLFVANLVSLLVGLVLSIPDLIAPSSSIQITIQRILRSGQPLLIVGILPSATAFIVSWLVTTLAGAATLGYVEGARIVGQPVTVLMVGLGAVLGPRITRAAGARDQATAERVGRRFERMILASGVIWALVVAAPAPINPLTSFLPVAYAVPGLVVGSIAAYTIMSLAQGRRYAMFGGGLERFVARSELEGNVARMLVALTVGAIGPWAVPIGIACLGVIRWVRATRWLVDYYAGRLVAPGRAPDPVRPAPPAGAASAAEERPG